MYKLPLPFCLYLPTAHALQLEIEAFQGIMKDALAEIDPNQFFHSLGILNPKQPLDV
jgi:hypothetical protein